VPLIDEFLSNHNLLQNDTISVTFNEKGVGSLVCILETKNGKMVLKIPLSKDFSSSEGLFLKTWKSAGVNVPNVIEEGTLSGYGYVLMEYIDAPLLSEVDILEKESGQWSDFEIGRVLRTMHIPKANGYGRVTDDKAEYSTFSEWVNSKKIQDVLNYVQENKILTIEKTFVDLAFSILVDHANKNQSSYCHFDFGGSNIFATNPITVFDPNPQFNNGYLDLGLTAFNSISAGLYPKQLIEGYFNNEKCDEKVLYASILLNSYIKLPSRFEKKKFDHIKNIEEYLVLNRYVLGK